MGPSRVDSLSAFANSKYSNMVGVEILAYEAETVTGQFVVRKEDEVRCKPRLIRATRNCAPLLMATDPQKEWCSLRESNSCFSLERAFFGPSRTLLNY